MGTKVTRVSVDQKKIRDYIYKNGDTYQKVSEAIGLDNTSFGRYLKQGELPKTVYMSILMHYGIKDTKFFESETAKQEEAKAEENRNILTHLSTISEKLDKLEYINKNTCELVDSINKLAESMNEFIKAMNG